MTSSLQEVVDGSGMEQRGREYLIQVHKVFRVRLDLQDLQVLKVQQVLKERLLHRVLRVLQELMELKVLLVQQVHKVLRVLKETLVVLRSIIHLNLTPIMLNQVQEI